MTTPADDVELELAEMEAGLKAGSAAAPAEKGKILTLNMAQYLALPAFSSGLCNTILTASPLHAWSDSWLNPNREREDSGKMDIGTYAHALLLEGGTDLLVVIEADDWRTKVAKEARDAARAEGKLPILAHKLPEVEAMVKAGREYVAGSELAAVFGTGAAEQTVVAELSGVPCKARPDWLTADRRLILSYKTTAGSANPEAWIRTQLAGYDAASVFYERAVASVSPDDIAPRLVHLVQEQAYPYSCSLIALSPAWRDLAERKVNAALVIWAQCVKTGRWPAYPSRICHAEPMAWHESQFIEGEANRQQLSEDDLREGVPL